MQGDSVSWIDELKENQSVNHALTITLIILYHACTSESIPHFSWKANPHNYDAWFDYLRLVESDADSDTIREVYERAIANVPPIQEKRHWKRYIYLWINYALYEELEAKVKENDSWILHLWLNEAWSRKFGTVHSISMCILLHCLMNHSYSWLNS